MEKNWVWVLGLAVIGCGGGGQTEDTGSYLANDTSARKSRTSSNLHVRCNSLLFGDRADEEASPVFDPDYWAQRGMGTPFANLSAQEQETPLYIAMHDSGVISSSDPAFSSVQFDSESKQYCTHASGDPDCHAAMVLSVMCSSGRCSTLPVSNTTVRYVPIKRNSNKHPWVDFLESVVDHNHSVSDPTQKIRLVNISQGQHKNRLYRSVEAIQKTIDNQQDFLVVVGAGNSFGLSEMGGLLGISPSKILPVTALHPHMDRLLPFSDFGDSVAFSAFGGLVKTHQKQEYASGGGTSIAAPLVSGPLALLFKVNPHLAIETAKDILARTTFGETRSDKTHMGHGLPNTVLATVLARALREGEVSSVGIGEIKIAASIVVSYVSQGKINVPVPKALKAFVPYFKKGFTTYDEISRTAKDCETYAEGINRLFVQYFLMPQENHKNELCQFYRAHLPTWGKQRHALALETMRYCTRYDNELLADLRQVHPGYFLQYVFPSISGDLHSSPVYTMVRDGLGDMIRDNPNQLSAFSEILAEPTVMVLPEWKGLIDMWAKNAPLSLGSELLVREHVVQHAMKIGKWSEWVEKIAKAEVSQANKSEETTPVLPSQVFARPSVIESPMGWASIQKWLPAYLDSWGCHTSLMYPFATSAFHSHSQKWSLAKPFIEKCPIDMGIFVLMPAIAENAASWKTLAGYYLETDDTSKYLQAFMSDEWLLRQDTWFDAMKWVIDQKKTISTRILNQDAVKRHSRYAELVQYQNN